MILPGAILSWRGPLLARPARAGGGRHALVCSDRGGSAARPV